MSRFVESICFDKGQYQLMDLHQSRIERTFREFYPLTIPFNLQAYLPDLNLEGKYKVRVVYDNQSVKTEYAEYAPATIKSLQIVETSGLDYTYKSAERSELERLKRTANADDMIVLNDGWVTDASYANLAFYDGAKWVTPRTYLLNGVKRQFYLHYGILSEVDMGIQQVANFQKVCLINAMLNLGDVEVSLDKVKR